MLGEEVNLISALQWAKLQIIKAGGVLLCFILGQLYTHSVTRAHTCLVHAHTREYTRTSSTHTPHTCKRRPSACVTLILDVSV